MIEADLVAQLADQSIAAGSKKQATDVLDAAIDRLQERGAEYAIEPLQRHSKNLKRRKT
jgi:predicted ATPase